MPISSTNYTPSFVPFDSSVELPDSRIFSNLIPKWKRFAFGIEALERNKLKVCEAPLLLDLFREMDELDIMFVIGSARMGILNFLLISSLSEIHPFDDRLEQRVVSLRQQSIIYRRLRLFEGTDLESFRSRVRDFESKSPKERKCHQIVAFHYNCLDYCTYELKNAIEEFEFFESLFRDIQENQRILGESVVDINGFGSDFFSVREIFYPLALIGRSYGLVWDDLTPRVCYDVFKRTVLDSLHDKIEKLELLDPNDLAMIEREKESGEERLERMRLESEEYINNLRITYQDKPNRRSVSPEATPEGAKEIQMVEAKLDGYMEKMRLRAIEDNEDSFPYMLCKAFFTGLFMPIILPAMLMVFLFKKSFYFLGQHDNI